MDLTYKDKANEQQRHDSIHIQYIHVCDSRMTMIIRRITLILNAILCDTATKELIQNGGFEDGTNGWGSMGETFCFLIELS